MWTTMEVCRRIALKMGRSEPPNLRTNESAEDSPSQRNTINYIIMNNDRNDARFI